MDEHAHAAHHPLPRTGLGGRTSERTADRERQGDARPAAAARARPEACPLRGAGQRGDRAPRVYAGGRAGRDRVHQPGRPLYGPGRDLADRDEVYRASPGAGNPDQQCAGVAAERAPKDRGGGGGIL